jgi:hypothetical protein
MIRISMSFAALVAMTVVILHAAPKPSSAPSEVLSAYELMIRAGRLPTVQVDEPF